MALNITIQLLFQSLNGLIRFAIEWNAHALGKGLESFNSLNIPASIDFTAYFNKTTFLFNTFLITSSSSILMNLMLLIVGILLLTVSIFVLKKSKFHSLFQDKASMNQKHESATGLSGSDEQLKKHNVELEELHKHYDQMIGMLAHDLKNPLNIIFHNLEGISNPSTKQSVENAGNLMMNMLQNALDIQKYAEDKLPIGQDTINLVDLISDSIQSVAYLTNKKNINIIYKSDLNYWVNVDINVIMRVMVSLLINLIKHTPLNESIIIRSQLQSGSLKLSFCINLDDKATDKVKSFFETDNRINPDSSLNSLFQCFRFCALAISAHKEDIGFNIDEVYGAYIWFTLPLKNSTNEQRDIKTKKPTEQFLFTEGDVETMACYIRELRKHSIFELSKLKSIINKIPDNSDGVVEWKEHVSLALSSMNEQRFIMLLDNVSKSPVNHEE